MCKKHRTGCKYTVNRITTFLEFTKCHLNTPITIVQCGKEKILKTVEVNPTLKPSDIACGIGVGFVPSAMDGASSHVGKVARAV